MVIDRLLTSLSLVVVQKAFNELKIDDSRKGYKTLLVDMLNRAMESVLINRNVALSVNTNIDNFEKKSVF